ncbi:MAG: hypothetical protein L6Q83_11790, partial [Gammaproteobacteria bacterium]|nr:hypothetical protein [Gammaproteobacteria bacterium]
TAKSLDLYRNCVGARLVQIAAASVAGLSLSHTVARAVLAGLFRSEHGFFRTPKQGRRRRVLAAIREAREEWLMAVALSIAAIGVACIDMMDSPDRGMWVIVLLVQTIPYWAAVIMSLVSAAPLPATAIGVPVDYLTRVADRPGAVDFPVAVEKLG